MHDDVICIHDDVIVIANDIIMYVFTVCRGFSLVLCPTHHTVIHWGEIWLSTALPPPPHIAPVGDECTQHGSSREGHHKDGVGETHSSTSTETSSDGFWNLAWHENKNITKRMKSL